MVSIILILLATATWVWHSLIIQHKPLEIAPDNWEHVKQQYPFPATDIGKEQLSHETAEVLLQSNPFSPLRKPISESEKGTTDTPSEPVAPPPKSLVFTYKGRVSIGGQERSIMQETTTKKTYFLQVGQAVAEFKVLDITQNQVVLSNLTTHEELVVSLASSAPPKKEMPTSP